MVDFSELDLLDFLSFFLSEDTRVPDTVERNFNQNTLSFNNDIVLKFIFLVENNIFISLKVEILIPPVLSSLGKEVSASKFLYPSFQDNDQFVDN